MMQVSKPGELILLPGSCSLRNSLKLLAFPKPCFSGNCLRNRRAQSSHRCAEHKGAVNSHPAAHSFLLQVVHDQTLQKRTAMKWQQIPRFGKVGKNWGMTKPFLKDRNNILKDHHLCRVELGQQQRVLFVGKGIPLPWLPPSKMVFIHPLHRMHCFVFLFAKHIWAVTTSLLCLLFWVY